LLIALEYLHQRQHCSSRFFLPTDALSSCSSSSSSLRPHNPELLAGAELDPTCYTACCVARLALQIVRGDEVVLTFEGSATATQETNSVVVKGTASVIGSNGTGAPCDVSSTTGELVQLRITIGDQSVFVPAARQGQSSPRCVQPADAGCSNIPFTMTLTSTTTQPTTVSVTAFWTPAAGGAPNEVPGCSAEGTISYVNPSRAVGETAMITQKLDYPDWKGMVISNWLNMEPSASQASISGIMPTVVTTTGSSNGVAVRATEGWNARWTVTISSIQFCLNSPQPVSCCS
jgi:hypothetical protein